MSGSPATPAAATAMSHPEAPRSRRALPDFGARGRRGVPLALSAGVFSPNAPTGFGWTRWQSVWIAAAVGVLSLFPARPVPEISARDTRGDARGPGTWILYEDVLEVNGAAALDLQRLPGVGPALAARLVQARDARGGFCELDELRVALSFGAKRWARVAPMLSVRPAPRCSSSSRG